MPTGPNRGYGCHQVYLETERTLDEAALQLGLDPAEIRRRNLIPADAFPYETPSGGLYDSGDYPRVLELALETAGYEELRAMQAAAREEGRLVGIGIGLAVDPSISNMGYITVALPPEVRQAPGYNPKSGASDWAQVRVNASGKVVVTMGTAPQGQGHETAVAQIVADELGLTPDDVATVDEFDSHTSVWSVSSGSYSSRFSGVATGAARRSAGVVKRQILEIGATLLEASADDLELADGQVRVKGSPDRTVSLRRVAGVAHWDPHGLPEGMSAGIQASEVFHIPSSAPPTDDDRVNSSHAYGFIADVVCGRGRPRHVADADPEVRVRARRRHDHQPEARRGAGVRRGAARARRRAARGVPLGRGRPVPDRLVRRLPRADRRRGAADRDGGDRDAVAVHAGRLEGLRRVGVRERAGSGRERGRRRAAAARPEAHAPAADPGPALGARHGEAGAVRVPPAGHARRGARPARRIRTRSRSPAARASSRC